MTRDELKDWRAQASRLTGDAVFLPHRGVSEAS